MGAWREELEGEDHGGSEEDEGAEDPHDSGSEDLILNKRDAEGIGVADVVLVDGAIAEGDGGGDQGVYQVGADEVEEDAPVALLRVRRPGTDDAPPEEERGGKEAEVLDGVPGLVVEGEVVGGGDVPGDEGEVHGEPGYGWLDQPGGEAAEGGAPDERGDDPAHDGRRKAAQERDSGESVEDEGRDDGHDEEVLDHVGAEERVGEAIHGGGDGEPEDEDAGDE